MRSRLLLSLSAVWFGLAGISALPVYAETHIASWNIQNLGWNNDKDYSALARIGANFDFISIQEVMNDEGISRMEAAIEAQSGEAWDTLCSHLVGRGSYKEMYCFLWRDSAVTWIDGAVVYLDDRNLFAREPFSARFETEEGIRFVATSIHSIYGKNVAQRQEEATALRRYRDWLVDSFPETPVFLMGDFNLPPTNPAWAPLGEVAYPLIQDEATTISTIDGRYANLYDNIWAPADVEIQVSAAGRLPFPQVMGITHEAARAHISDHIPVFMTLDANAEPISFPAHVKNNSVGKTANEGDEAAAPAPAVIGNQRSKIFHLPHCPGYHKTSERNRVPFASPEDAEAEGYRMARNC